ncbi:MAG: hypothetical protein JXR49_04100, partial [Acidobacteria bacterium]|nr:hypothetical protein [Acidobacteriota bacterium]
TGSRNRLLGLKNVRKTVKKSAAHACRKDTDYRIDSVVFEDGRSLDEGIMYSPEAANPMRLAIRIVWNEVSGPYGIQCSNHKLAIVDSRGSMILNPATIPAPDRNGVITMPVRTMIPPGLRVGDPYSFRVTYRPADPACDSDSSNNERSFSTRLVRMGGNDLVVRIHELNYRYPDLSVTYEVNNLSGTEILGRVRVTITIERTKQTKRIIVSRLSPGTWARYTHSMRFEKPAGAARGETMVTVTIDPENEFSELREDNNSAGKRIRW